jgi:DNA-binding transcriptional MerR regulator
MYLIVYHLVIHCPLADRPRLIVVAYETNDGEYRIDDLAREAGVPSTTIRLYQTKGLLPAPVLVGRTGWYGGAHLERLRLIARLRAQGFSLAGIGALLERRELGGDLDDLLGSDERLAGLLGRRRPTEVSPQELLERFPTQSMSPELLQRAGALGLLQVTETGTVTVPDARFLDAGSALAEMGVPLDRILDEWQALSSMTDDVAARFADLFESLLLAPDWREQLDAKRIDELTDLLGRLRQLGEQVLLAALDDSIARVAAERFAELLDES